MKQKFISLALAVMLLLGVTGCAMSTPASVGSVGGVDIPAGVYPLAQEQLTYLLAPYQKVRDFVWRQEAPPNTGARKDLFSQDGIIRLHPSCDSWRPTQPGAASEQERIRPVP